jgi:hypothetical protein
MLIREDQAAITVSLNANGDGRTWTPIGPTSWVSAEGGVLEADDAKTRAGGMGREVSAGGPASRNDLTVKTQFTDVLALAHPGIENCIGSGRIKVGLSYLNPDRTPNGQGRTLQGSVKSAAEPDMGTGSAVGEYTVVVSCDELASAA